MNKIGLLALIGVLAVFMSTLVSARPQSQNDLAQADGFVFDGPADRPSKFPPSGGRPTQSTPIDMPPTNPTDTNNQLTTTTTQSPQVFRCLQSCPVTSEYNPVCGSDGVTYSNPGKLSCAQFCGSSVQGIRIGPCNSTMRGK